MNRYSLILIALILSCSFLYGQDKLYLSNGSKIKGNVFTSVSHDSVYVETKDGYGFYVPRPLVKGVRYNRRKVFSEGPQFLNNKFRDDFGKYRFKPLKADTFAITKEDYFRFIAGFNMSTIYNSEFHLFPQIIYGYKYNDLLNLALFVRYNNFQSINLMPFGLHYEYDFRTTKGSPFIYFEYGGSLAFGSLITNGIEGKARGGVNYSIGAGHVVKLENSDLRFSIGMLNQKVNFDYEQFPPDNIWYNIFSSRTHYRFFISIGYSIY